MKHNFKLSFTWDDKTNKIVDDQGNVFDFEDFKKKSSEYFPNRLKSFETDLINKKDMKAEDSRKSAIYKGSRVKYALSIVKKHQLDPNYTWTPTDYDLEDTTRSSSAFRNVLNLSIEAEGVNTDLNWIDVSNITDMSLLFSHSNFNGDISKWDVSNVTNMSFMFNSSDFNNNSISNWDVSNVTNMNHMFYESSFNGDLSNWDVTKAAAADHVFNMFSGSSFNGDVSNWDMKDIPFGNVVGMFNGTPLYKNNNLPEWYTKKEEEDNDPRVVRLRPKKKESTSFTKFASKIQERNQFSKDIKKLLNN